jgi:hypothetical protein
MARITRGKRKNKLSKGSKKVEFNGDFRPLGFIFAALVVSALLFIFSSGFRDWVISIVAKIVDTLILSNLFVFNLAVILVLFICIIVAIFIFRRL